jgi:phosphate transport system substrate-binding protein
MRSVHAAAARSSSTVTVNSDELTFSTQQLKITSNPVKLAPAMIVGKVLNRFRVYFWSIFLSAAACFSVAAQEIRLSSRDGALTIAGDLLGYDGEFYRLETIYGPLTFDAKAVTCEGTGCPDLNAYVAEFTLSGTRQMADVLVPALIQSFADREGFSVRRRAIDATHSIFELNDDTRLVARLSLRTTSTAEGYADLIAEEADIALALRPPQAREISLAEAAGLGDLTKGRRARVIALDGMVAVTGVGGGIQTLTLELLANIFAGNSGSFDGEARKLAIHLPDQMSGLAESFQDKVLTPRNLAFDPNATFHTSLGELTSAVAADPFAVGLTTLSELNNAQPIRISDGCGVEQSATLSSIRAEDYPLTIPLMFYSPTRRLPKMARNFLAFAETRQADVIIRRMGFVDQSILATDFTYQGGRLAQAIKTAGSDVSLRDLQALVSRLSQRSRLSTTFRFAGNSTKLDVQSRENLVRLARALEVGAFDGEDLLLAGFTSGRGAGAQNLKRSRAKAQIVLDQIKDIATEANFDQINLDVAGFGEALPMACDGSEWGRALNDRIEIWVK